MENEILEILKRLENKIDENTKDIKDLKEGQQRIEKKLDVIYDQVARAAEDIDDMSTVETVTAKNWADIVKLKAIK